ncbi:hypothetical protein IVB22_01995 [Bradyrhizobium sp. 190]|uniref:hypothetical protein n=1 Tax=Bradyrhizobium sp. 190 TaxID=2782658 RepID=UPI001FFAF755|nr:hypothetical protein [Bradyrhizobium sp. 190]MCK1511362.1 hypothetical protein [Bradyrhizobium sp. 190]
MGNSSDSPEKVDGLTGTVARGSFGEGSKSEREAIWLEADGRRLVLRRKGGPSFGDQSLEKYVGKRVKCDGFVVGYTLLAERIETLG